ncbi:hypothetical protein AKJ37_00775 [candidate division MSBL1 archaeon SCGC-AAA259I09]|uniref:Uncharacterized protein n=1 Tax=candidate division MSBL1 archaeon SCGC-AAA259I09 TaxID=1698267 RepID=A0A133UVP5_9EURY|nr:hypothetical protein AKJ37_00775 [candidate division MSBL1 archaeon SCGC-AAA259I09]
MGMYDRIQFDEPRECPNCGEEIESVQTKKFRKLLDTYEVGDCVDHAEETRIAGEDTYCSNCSERIDPLVYLVVDRGILVGVADTMEEAKQILGGTNKERLVFMYHDLYDRLREERRERRKYSGFLKEVGKWYAKSEEEREDMSPFEEFGFKKSRFLKNGPTPLQAIHDFLSYEKLLDSLDNLEDEGEPLEIYWVEDIEKGRKKWAVDILNDKLNERCNTNWVWTVISQAQLDEEGNEITDVAPWHISTEDEYSEGAVVDAVSNWLSRRGLDLDVDVISVEEAEGSGTLEKLEELSEKDLESERYVPLEDWLENQRENSDE